MNTEQRERLTILRANQAARRAAILAANQPPEPVRMTDEQRVRLEELRAIRAERQKATPAVVCEPPRKPVAPVRITAEQRQRLEELRAARAAREQDIEAEILNGPELIAELTSLVLNTRELLRNN